MSYLHNLVDHSHADRDVVRLKKAEIAGRDEIYRYRTGIESKYSYRNPTIPQSSPKNNVPYTLEADSLSLSAYDSSLSLKRKKVRYGIE